jgi:hypothetical protein
MWKWLLCTAFLAYASFGVWAASSAPDIYPTKPIRLIVGFPPGGADDSVARVIAPKIAERLGQTVIVDNRPGAAGNLGTEIAARANADGYTLLQILAGMELLHVPYKGAGPALIGVAGGETQIASSSSMPSCGASCRWRTSKGSSPRKASSQSPARPLNSGLSSQRSFRNGVASSRTRASPSTRGGGACLRLGPRRPRTEGNLPRKAPHLSGRRRVPSVTSLPPIKLPASASPSAGCGACG